MPSRAKIAAAIGLAIVAVSFAGVLIRGLALSGIPLLAVAFYRMAFATAALGGASVVGRTPLPRRSDAPALVFSGLCLAAHFGLWTLAFQYTPVARAVLIVQSQAIFVVIASALVLGERPSKRTVAGVALAVLGIATVSADGLGGGSDTWRGDLLALGGAVAVAGYILAGRYARARLGLLGYVVPVYSVASAALLGMCLATGVPLGGFAPSTWLGFALLAAIPTILGHTVFNWIIGYVRADTVSLAFLAEPVGAALLALLFFREVPSAYTLAGAPLILCGLALAST